MAEKYEEIKDPIGTKEASKIMGCDASHVRRLIINDQLEAHRNPKTGHWGIERQHAVDYQFSDDPRGRPRGKKQRFKQTSWIPIIEKEKKATFSNIRS